MSMQRFIQFNDESVDPNERLLYERLATAFCNFRVEVTERQALEWQLRERTLALSVFWRHRSEDTVRLGRLSDLYLLTLGFWSSFQLDVWRKGLASYEGPLPHFVEQMSLLFEEWRLIEQIENERPGTKRAFRVREETYREEHRNRLRAHLERHRLIDAAWNELYLYGVEGTLRTPSLPDSFPHAALQRLIERRYTIRSTEESVDAAVGLATLLEPHVDRDLFMTYYAFGSWKHAAEETSDRFQYSRGMTTEERGSSHEKETMEDEFRSWHRATEDDDGIHLQFELNDGTLSRSLSDDALEGEEGATPDTIRQGRSSGSVDTLDAVESLEQDGRTESGGGAGYGLANANVTVSVEPMEKATSEEALAPFTTWRHEQAPLVDAFVREMNERMEKKKTARRTGLSHGRLDGKALLSLVTDERPAPFYKKGAPDRPLDAVFGLLIDGSASMHDKLDETKRAVLLFHDVLRRLAVPHEMIVYSEDATRATPDEQPNTFEVIHSFHDGARDAAPRIANIEAHDDNRDGFAIRWMTDRLLTRPEQHRVLLLFSDGEPSAYDYGTNGLVDTRDAVLRADRLDVSLFHLFLTDVEPTADERALFQQLYGTRTVAADRMDEWAEETLRLLRIAFRLIHP